MILTPVCCHLAYLSQTDRRREVRGLGAEGLVPTLTLPTTLTPGSAGGAGGGDVPCPCVHSGALHTGGLGGSTELSHGSAASRQVRGSVRLVSSKAALGLEMAALLLGPHMVSPLCPSIYIFQFPSHTGVHPNGLTLMLLSL